MDNLVVFSATTQGFLHKKREVPCQDASGCYVDPQGRFAAIAVADGHGDPTCVRSDRGSALVVDVALDCMRLFGESCLSASEDSQGVRLMDELSIPRRSDDVIRRLTDALLARWYEAAMDDLSNEPLTPEELDRASSYAALYSNGQELEHAYGTTLIAALYVGDNLLLLQQGDGRCVVLREDASAFEPIPWDARCHENVTTSVSDTDAAESMRHAILHTDGEDSDIVACLLGSDGVEDSFHDEEGRWDYYRRLCMRLTDLHNARTRRKDFESVLHETLPSFSKEGSGDDVSIAGMASMRELMMARDEFDDLIEQYQLGARLQEARAKLLSMERMHEHLARAASDGSEAQQDAFRRYDAVYEQLKAQTQQLEEDLLEWKRTQEGSGQND